MGLKSFVVRSIWLFIPESWGNRYQRRSIDRTFRVERAKLKAKNAGSDEFAALDANEYHTWQQLEEDIGRTRGKKLWSFAQDLDIELPNSDPSMWQTTDDGQVTFLNVKGRARVRKLVHEEAMRTFDLRYAYFSKIILPLLGLLVALGGLVISYVALHKKASPEPEKKPAIHEQLISSRK
jgi:hypothetical protein